MLAGFARVCGRFLTGSCALLVVRRWDLDAFGWGQEVVSMWFGGCGSRPRVAEEWFWCGSGGGLAGAWGVQEAFSAVFGSVWQVVTCIVSGRCAHVALIRRVFESCAVPGRVVFVVGIGEMTRARLGGPSLSAGLEMRGLEPLTFALRTRRSPN